METTPPQEATSQAAGQATDSSQARQGPVFTVQLQYLRDLSFENPNAPETFEATRAAPSLETGITVETRQLSDPERYEVLVHLKGRATLEGKVLYLLEVTYAGVVRIAGVEDKVLQALLRVETPHLLFPFARNAFSDAVQAGGYPPALLQPVDFAALYRSYLAKRQQTPDNAATAAAASPETLKMEVNPA